MRDAGEDLAVVQKQRRHAGSAQTGRVRENGAEYRLQVVRRARDHAEDLARRRLLLLRLCQPLLEFLAARAVSLHRLADDQGLGRVLGLCAPCPSAHWPRLVAHRSSLNAIGRAPQLPTTARIAASMISRERSISAWVIVSGGATRHTQ